MTKRLASKKHYRIALLGDFKEDSPRGLQIIGRKIHKGFVRNGHDVFLFSYRQHLLAQSPFAGKSLARKLAKKKTDKLCCKLLKDYQPDLVVLLAYRTIDSETISELIKVLPDTYFAGWYPDQLDGFSDESLKTNKCLDAFMATGAGLHLDEIAKMSGNLPTAFIPNPCDPDIEKPYPQGDSPVEDLFFTGKYSHRNYSHDGSREPLLKQLAKEYGLIIHGNGENPAILGSEYLRSISNSKIAISININNSFNMYHSDRIINYLASGAFVLSSYVPDSELLFVDHKHLRYFHSNEQCMELIKYYLNHENERKMIAKAGMDHVHKTFACQRIANDIIEFLITGTYNQPFKYIVEQKICNQ